MSRTRHPKAPNHRQHSIRRRILPILCTATLVLAALWAPTRESAADDRDLLRFNTAKPYVFLLLDTSGSMNLAPGDVWVPGSGDNPNSKIYQVKEALYEVFQDVDDVHLGFATFNQDESRAQSKHWRYAGVQDGSLTSNPVQTGEIFTFGRHLEPSAAHPEVSDVGVLGTCDDPVSLVTERDLVLGFPLLGTFGDETTELWVEDQSQTYLVEVSTTGPTFGLGQSQIFVTFNVHRASGCSPPDLEHMGEESLEFSFESEFLSWDSIAGNDAMGGLFEVQDMLTSATCQDSHPFTGKGWEGNYDSGVVTGDPAFDAKVTDVDPYCTNPGGNSCRNIKHDTTLSGLGRELDRGDMIPFHWNLDNMQTFLERLAPNIQDNEAPEFGVAPYFEDFPDGEGSLPLRNPGRRPLFAAGTDSSLGKAIADFRCWYFGQGANKCRLFGAPDGWETLAQDADSEWGCRRPYLIVISDGEDTCQGENPCADTANLNSKGGIKSWVLTYGGEDRPPLSCIARNGKGELIFVDNKDELVQELNAVLGLIREESRAFATAAAPSVQTKVADKIYLSSFTPLNNKSIWDGHLRGFLRPLVLDGGKPDLTSDSFLWDTGHQIRDVQAPTQAQADVGNLRLGPAESQRRLFYSRLRTSDGLVEAGEWPFRRRLLDVTEDSTAANIRYDLWRAFEIPFDPDTVETTEAVVVDPVAQGRANQVLADLMAIKEHTLDDGVEISYVMGDIFHSDPLVIGRPTNVRFFAQDLEGDGTDCEDGNPGYRCFFRKHQYRRRMLVVGTNEGVLHAFDAGRTRRETVQGVEEISIDDGTGNEIFGFTPRAVMPTMRRLAEGTNHHFTVDGSASAADVFIDPVFSGSPVASEREWRTVAITGLREGGSAYFALDITQPDIVDENYLPPETTDYTPTCLGPTPTVSSASYPNDDCGPVPFPAALWEFDDSVLDLTAAPPRYRRLDEDLNGAPDLAYTWSKPNIGMIEICDGGNCDPDALGNNVERKHVAVFGGGMDPENKLWDPRDGGDPGNLSGNWLYIVDIETGEPIYKRPMVGSVASEPAAVDTDQDGVLDRIYVGTVAGYLYRVDIGLDSSGHVPALADVNVTDVQGVTHTVRRIPALDSDGEDLWKPRILFDANFDESTPTLEPRPLHHPPSVVFIANLGMYALTFGTGDREDLWSGTSQEGKIYIFVDDSDFLAPNTVMTEDDFARVLPDSNRVDENYLVTRDPGQRGWYLVLNEDERVITDVFALIGVTFFSTYNPHIDVSGGRDPLCSKTGTSRVFVADATNANAFLSGVDGNPSRYFEVSTFVTNPYTETSQTQNPIDGGGDPPGDPLPEDMQALMEALRGLYPSNCKFANYRIDIKAITADTGVVHIAPVPVCIVEKNWKEF